MNIPSYYNLVALLIVVYLAAHRVIFHAFVPGAESAILAVHVLLLTAGIAALSIWFKLSLREVLISHNKTWVLVISTVIIFGYISLAVLLMVFPVSQP